MAHWKKLAGATVASLFAAPLAFGEAALWLFPDEALPDALGDGYDLSPLYVGENEDPWLTESYVYYNLDGEGFILDVYNHGRGAGDNTAYKTQLVLSIYDIAEFTGGTVDGVELTQDSFTYGVPKYSCSGRDLPSHGVIPTWYTIVDLGTIEQDAIRQVPVIMNGSEFLQFHFDAYAEGKLTKKIGKQTVSMCTDIFNPFSHDVTTIGGGTEPPPACEFYLQIDKTGPTQATAGGFITYTINYATTGSTCDQNNVILTDSLPTFTVAGVTLPAMYVTSASTGCATADNLTLTCELGSLAVEESGTISVTGIVNPLLAGGTIFSNLACIDSAEADEVCDSADTTTVAPPIVNNAGEDVGTPGFWCQQLDRAANCSATPDVICKNNQKFTFNETDGWYQYILLFSRVYDELGRASTYGDGNALICNASETDTAALKLQRHLLTLWFNLRSHQVNAGLTLGSFCAGPVALPSGADSSWTVAYVMVSAESALLAGSDDATLLFWKDVVDFIDNAGIPGVTSGCL